MKLNKKATLLFDDRSHCKTRTIHGQKYNKFWAIKFRTNSFRTFCQPTIQMSQEMGKPKRPIDNEGQTIAKEQLLEKCFSFFAPIQRKELHSDLVISKTTSLQYVRYR